MKLSLVTTVYNEEENIEPLIAQVSSALKLIDYEFIIVDDGSTDHTLEKIRKHRTARTKYISFRRNYGQTTALAAGIDLACGEYIATIDGDLQNDPRDLPAMLQALEEGPWDVIVGQRERRQDYWFSRKLPSRIANSLIRLATGIKSHDLGCSLKIFKQDIAKGLNLFGEMHRFIAVLAVLQGAKIHEVKVRHHPRQFGDSKYGWGRIIRVLSDLCLIIFMQRYFRRPIHLFGTVGLFSIFFGMAINLYLLASRLLGHDIWGRPILILGAVMTLAGLHFLTFGVILELLMRTYFAAQQKKTYTVKDAYIGTHQSWQKSQQDMEKLAKNLAVRSDSLVSFQ